MPVGPRGGGLAAVFARSWNPLILYHVTFTVTQVPIAARLYMMIMILSWHCNQLTAQWPYWPLTGVVLTGVASGMMPYTPPTSSSGGVYMARVAITVFVAHGIAWGVVTGAVSLAVTFITSVIVTLLIFLTLLALVHVMVVMMVVMVVIRGKASSWCLSLEHFLPWLASTIETWLLLDLLALFFLIEGVRLSDRLSQL